MTKDEAIAEINIGQKVTHRRFPKDGYVQRTPENIFMYILSGSTIQSAFDFWELREDEHWLIDWEIYHEPDSSCDPCINAKTGQYD